MKIPLVQKNILDWYAQEKRDLPWRETTDPYKILVSEIMLQQTQVDRVIPKYQNFLLQFPTVESLAKASSAEVIVAWSGLGFNRRALRLAELAKKIVQLKKFPETEKELLILKGIGPYTASAVASFAFNQDVIVLDTNIRRVFHRLSFEHKTTQNELLTKELETLAARLLPKGNSRIWHNALMDFGATICLAQTPKCLQCPIQTLCSFKKVLETSSREEQQVLLSLTRVKNKQGTFKNSERFYRGKILDYLRMKGSCLEEELLKSFQEIYQKDVRSLLKILEKEQFLTLKDEKVFLSL